MKIRLWQPGALEEYRKNDIPYKRVKDYKTLMFQGGDALYEPETNIYIEPRLKDSTRSVMEVPAGSCVLRLETWEIDEPPYIPPEPCLFIKDEYFKDLE